MGSVHCSGICEEASYWSKRLTLAERGRNRRLKINDDNNDDEFNSSFRICMFVVGHLLDVGIVGL